VHGPTRQRIVDALSAIGEGLTIQQLTDRVYADDPSGGPLTAHASLNAMMRRANAELAAQGHRIVASSRGIGARYRLCPI
jgi:hypothetical protein